VALPIALLLLLAALGNVFWWNRRGVRTANAEFMQKAGVGVVKIDLSKNLAVVWVTKAWHLAQNQKEHIHQLCEALETKKVTRAVLMQDGSGGGGLGILDVTVCKAVGLAPPPPPPADPTALPGQ
jgi:hypothetical protein